MLIQRFWSRTNVFWIEFQRIYFWWRIATWSQLLEHGSACKTFSQWVKLIYFIFVFEAYGQFPDCKRIKCQTGSGWSGEYVPDCKYTPVSTLLGNKRCRCCFYWFYLNVAFSQTCPPEFPGRWPYCNIYEVVCKNDFLSQFIWWINTVWTYCRIFQLFNQFK